MTIFSERIKNLRIENGYGQRKIALDLGVNQCTVSRWENGLQEPSLDMLIEIARYFNVSIDYIVGLTDD